VFIRLHQLLRRGRGQEGSVAVEFALILPILLLLIAGALDMGHMYYIDHLITNASREGARYAAKYTGSAAAPTSAAVSNYVKLPPPLPGGLNYNAFNLDSLTVTAVPAGAFPNKIVTVTVTAHKNWWVLGNFNFYGFQPFPNPKTLTAQTAMNVEH
jgi:Flp pilus assembly protein TadG